MAESSINSGVQWVYRFYRDWRNDRFGAENGKSLFDQLEQEVIKFNQLTNLEVKLYFKSIQIALLKITVGKFQRRAQTKNIQN